MSHHPKVILVSNDIVPGCGLPVAAPGLRVHGLASGLKGRGFDVTTVIVRGPLSRQWRAAIPPALPLGGIPLTASGLADYLTAQAPAVVVLTNSNQIDYLGTHPDNRLILDFFAPKLLELVYDHDATSRYPLDELRALRRRKLRAIERADGFIVNGEKKVPYFLAWLLQSDRDIRTLPFEPVGMCLPSSFEDRRRRIEGEPVRFGMAGYLQGWSLPGTWLRALPPLLDSGACTLDTMMPGHWGGLGSSAFASEELNRLVASHAIRIHSANTFTAYRRFIAGCDIVLDLFDRNRERELAVVTRTISALCCGAPVVHPPFTEVSPLIARYDAGWLLDPAEESGVARVLREIVEDPSVIERKAVGVRRLWEEQLCPSVAVEGLVKVIAQIGEPARPRERPQLRPVPV